MKVFWGKTFWDEAVGGRTCDRMNVHLEKFKCARPFPISQCRWQSLATATLSSCGSARTNSLLHKKQSVWPNSAMTEFDPNLFLCFDCIWPDRIWPKFVCVSCTCRVCFFFAGHEKRRTSARKVSAQERHVRAHWSAPRTSLKEGTSPSAPERTRLRKDSAKEFATHAPHPGPPQPSPSNAQAHTEP